jgi:nucleosome binding factor SPN SPT16 subunit
MAERVVLLNRKLDVLSILKKQLRMAYNQKNPPKAPLQSLRELKGYLKAFVLGMYEFSYGFRGATIMFRESRNSFLHDLGQ